MALCTPRKCIQVILFISFVSFITVNLHFFSPVRPLPASVEKSDVDFQAITVSKPKVAPISLVHKTLNRQLPNVKPPEDKTKRPNIDSKKQAAASADRKTQSSVEKRFSQFNESLEFIISDINEKQIIRNRNKFPPIKESDTYDHVLAIQVHNRDNYLNYLIKSLRSTKYINSSLLVVSHDFYSQSVFDIIDSIDFMPVIQIFYPKAMQLYKDKYPGPDPQDCPRNIPKHQAMKSGCINADHPDKYGHYREAAYAQTKLHWFWKLNHIFEKLTIMKNFTGYVTLIEEDHYVTPDMLHVFHEMVAAKSRLCAQCRVLTLGNYEKKPSYSFSNEVVIAADFISSKHNMAMSINKETYEHIKRHNQEFCNYDDYNWDWSLQYIGKENIVGRLPTMIVKTPRVYHIGDCGVHHKGKKCNPEEKVKPITDLIQANQGKLYPTNLKVGRPTSTTSIAYKKFKANGGWGDKRDHDLCASFML